MELCVLCSSALSPVMVLEGSSRSHIRRLTANSHRRGQSRVGALETSQRAVVV